MIDSPKITRESERLIAVARPSVRGKHAVELYWKQVPIDRRSPIAVDRVSLSVAAERDRVIEALPGGFAEYADEAKALLMQLAAEVAATPLVESPAGTTSNSAAVQETALEPSPDAINGAELLTELADFIAWFVVLPTGAAEAIALWIVHTYLVDVSDFTPYLLVTSPVRECGKSTLLDLLVHLAWNARKTDGITPAALYRVIERDKPAMLMDEIDARLKSDGGEYLRGVLNSGFARGGRVTICAGDNNEPRDYSTFGPKVLAGIGRVWDTVTSRSIPIRLARADRAELAKLSRIRGDRIETTCRPFRRALLRWARDTRDLLRENDPEVPTSLGARQADVWRPLLAIADLAGGEWPAEARRAATTLYSVADEEGDYGLLLLEDIRALFEASGAVALATEHVLAGLHKMEHRPWPEYRNDKPITARGLARLLSRFGVRPKTIRLGPETTAKGYERAHLAPVFKAYLPATTSASDLSVTCVTPAADRAVTDVTAAIGPRAETKRRPSDDRGSDGKVSADQRDSEGGP